MTRVEMVDDCTRVDAEKVDAATGEPLAGATMQVVDAEGEAIEEWVSDGEPHRIEALGSRRRAKAGPTAREPM